MYGQDLVFSSTLCVIQGVLDITTTEVADHIVGGVMACDSTRFDAIIEKKVPLVLSVGALDMVNFGAKDAIPSSFQQRKIHEHNKQVMRLKIFFPLHLASCHSAHQFFPSFSYASVCT